MNAGNEAKHILGFFAKAAVRVLRHQPGIIVMEDPGFVVPQLWPLASDKFM